ncbi:MAG: tetratricopeptide repeat protein [Bacteroidota bacterium]|nr:tetratricopeptide repeat protein [Bacteroidota bacterium]
MKFHFTVLLLFWAFFCFGQAPSKGSDYYDHLADSLQKSGQDEELEAFLQNELKADPKNEAALRWLGILAIDKGNLVSGEQYYREAIAVNPNCARCYMNIGRTYAIRKEYKIALQMLDKAISLDAKDAALFEVRALIKESSGDLFGASLDYNKAIELAPKDPEAYLARADFNTRRGYDGIAYSDFTKAIELVPAEALPRYKRSSYYYDHGMFDEALIDISIAIELDSSSAIYYNGRAAIYAAKQMNEKALADYAKSIRLDSTDYFAYFSRASVKFAMEDIDGAADDFRFSYSLLKSSDPSDPFLAELQTYITEFADSTNPGYYYQRGIGFFNLKQYDKAIAMYTAGLEKFPGDAMTLSFRANAFFAKQEYEKAIPDYYAALENKTNVLVDIRLSHIYKNASIDSVNAYLSAFTVVSYLYIAQSRFALKQYSQALIDVNKGISIPPVMKETQMEELYNVRGNIFIALGKNDSAIVDFDRCIVINPSFSAAYVNRAVAKINLSVKVQITSCVAVGGVDQPCNANWIFPAKIAVNKNGAYITSALEDCNKAITSADKNGYAYYVRGQLKKMLGMENYCYDFKNANELGYPVGTALLKECVR